MGAAADAAGAGDCGGDPGRAAGAGADAADVDGAASGGVGKTVLASEREIPCMEQPTQAPSLRCLCGAPATACPGLQPRQPPPHPDLARGDQSLVNDTHYANGWSRSARRSSGMGDRSRSRWLR